jgi:hypothetical protein
MTKYLLTNEVIVTELWKILVTNPAYSEDLTTKASPGKAAVCTYYKFRPGVDNATAGDFPDIALAKSGWRTESALNGNFASGTWTFKVRLENTTKYGFSVKVAIRLSKSTNADGSNATLIIVSESPNVLALPASAGGSVSDTWTWSAPQITLSNEYLFAEYRIHIEVAGTSTTCECAFACDENPTVADESIETTTYTPTVPIPGQFNKLAYATEPPTTGAFNKLKYVSEPPVPGAWNKLAYEGE